MQICCGESPRTLDALLWLEFVPLKIDALIKKGIA